MQNEEKMLTISRAYDATYDFLEKIYNKTKSEDVFTIFTDMPLLADGKSADPAILCDWNEAAEKLLTQNPDILQSYELANKKFNIIQAYQVMIYFLETYDYFPEIVALVNTMKLSNNETPINMEIWTSWIESVDKILNQKTPIRPLLLFIGARMLTLENAYHVLEDYLYEYHNRTKSNSIGSFINKMKLLDVGQTTNPEIWPDWIESAYEKLNEKPQERQNFELFGKMLAMDEAYDAAIIFLEKYRDKINSVEIINMLVDMKISNGKRNMSSITWNYWTESVNKILNINPCSGPLFFCLDANLLFANDAYSSVFNYLNKVYEKTKSTEIYSLIDGMYFFEDGTPTDPVIYEDWHKSVCKALNENKSELSDCNLSLKEAYNAMIYLLETYHARTNFKDIANLLEDMRLLNNGTSTNPVAWDNWLEVVDLILSQKPRFRPYSYLLSNESIVTPQTEL
ncbi:MAG: hypothetical protein V1646_01610 [bacterium]